MNTARLVETADNLAPPGARLHALKTADGVTLRAATWLPARTRRGTILVCTGRTEFIEKYFEFIGEILERGYAVACFDWRGQGLSQRLLDDPTKGHVDSFAAYDRDMDAAVDGLLAEMPKPWVLFGHSMGGHVALRHLARRPADFERAFLSAPMLRIWLPWSLRLISGGLAAAMCAAGRGQAFTPGGAGNDGLAIPFKDNRVTGDPVRYRRNNDILRAEPALALCGPTWRWLRAAFASMRLLRRPAFAARIVCPLLIVGAAHDEVVHQGPDLTLIRRVRRGLFVLFSDARHELVQERDRVRRVMWHAVDAFLDSASDAGL
ncbi:MAG: alpha/beta hydrolase [Alphaproteobacteria bacterium]|nr:alpha/beta hydrolase [Alphaproteobacteria bacterium]